MITNKRKTIGVFMNRADKDFQHVVQRVCRRRTKELGYDVFYFITVGYRDSVNYYDAQEKGMFSFVPVENLDGALVTPDSYDMAGFREALFEMLDKRPDLPVVCIRDSLSNRASFYTDENEAMRTMIRHLLDDHGYRRVCFQSGYEGHPDSEKRMKCYLEEMEKRGIPLPENAIWHGTLWTTEADKAYDYFFHDPENIPEAIVCANDYMAKALIDEIMSHGYDVPGDVAVTGFDDIVDAATNCPSLTTVGQDYEEMALRAINLLHECIEAREKGDIILPTEHVPLPGKPAMRESCGCSHPMEPMQQRREISKLNQQLRNINNREVSQTYFSIELNVVDDYEGIHNTIFKKLGDTPNIRDFYLCLFENEDGNLADGITDRVRIISAIRDRQNIGSLNLSFDRQEILPAFVEREGEPQAFYIHLHHQRDNTYGYSALQLFDDEVPSMFYMHWNIIISVALRNLKNQKTLEALYEERHKASITDVLTGLNNRRGLDEHVSPVWDDMCREKKTVCFISLDLDNLKPINDTFGHQGGDEALITIARAIEAAVPKTAVAARIGGDEFLVFIPDCDEEGVAAFRRAFDAWLAERNKGARFTVGSSVGARVARLDEHTEMEPIIHASDEAMYTEKKRRHAELKRHASTLK